MNSLVKSLAFLLVGAVVSFTGYITFLNPPSHADYETCIEVAAVKASYAEALVTMKESCDAQYPARRNPGGPGYVYVDGQSGLSFDVLSAVPSEEEWVGIFAEVERHEAQLAKVAQEQAVREEEQRIAAELDKARLAREASDRAAQVASKLRECRQRNDDRLANWKQEARYQIDKIRYPKKSKYLPDIYHDRTGLTVDFVNKTDFPISKLTVKYAWTGINHCPSTFGGTEVIVSQKNLRPDVWTRKFFIDQSNANNLDRPSWLCLELDEVIFDHSPYLENCEI